MVDAAASMASEYGEGQAPPLEQFTRFRRNGPVEDVDVLALRPDPAARAVFDDALLESIEAARAVHSDGILPVLRLERQGEVRLLVSEHAPGRWLNELIAGGAALDPAIAMQIVLDVGKTIETLHAAAVVHGDVRSANVRVTDDGRVRLTGIGVSGVLPLLTFVEPLSIHRLVYRPAEELRGGRPSKSSDVFSLGILIHELFVGRVPFTGTTPSALLASMGVPLLSVSLRKNGVPESIVRPLLKMLSPTSIGRCSSSAAVRLLQLAARSIVPTGQEEMRDWLASVPLSEDGESAAPVAVDEPSLVDRAFAELEEEWTVDERPRAAPSPSVRRAPDPEVVIPMTRVTELEDEQPTLVAGRRGSSPEVTPISGVNRLPSEPPPVVVGDDRTPLSSLPAAFARRTTGVDVEPDLKTPIAPLPALLAILGRKDVAPPEEASSEATQDDSLDPLEPSVVITEGSRLASGPQALAEEGLELEDLVYRDEPARRRRRLVIALVVTASVGFFGAGLLVGSWLDARSAADEGGPDGRTPPTEAAAPVAAEAAAAPVAAPSAPADPSPAAPPEPAPASADRAADALDPPGAVMEEPAPMARAPAQALPAPAPPTSEPAAAPAPPPEAARTAQEPPPRRRPGARPAPQPRNAAGPAGGQRAEPTPRAPRVAAPRTNAPAAEAGFGTLAIVCSSRCEVRVDGSVMRAALGGGARMAAGPHAVDVANLEGPGVRTLRLYVPAGATVRRRVSF